MQRKEERCKEKSLRISKVFTIVDVNKNGRDFLNLVLPFSSKNHALFRALSLIQALRSKILQTIHKIQNRLYGCKEDYQSMSLNKMAKQFPSRREEIAEILL